MKKSFIISVLIIGSLLNTHAQKIGNLDGIFYQAVAIDNETREIVGKDIVSKPLYNKTIQVRFTITNGINGPVQWQEVHETITDKYGLFTLTIGQGEITSATPYMSMLEIPWIDAIQFLKVEIDSKNNGNFELVSYQKFMSVPYAFYCDDIADDAILTSKILDSTIVNADMHTAAIDSRTILDETIIAADIHTGAVESDEILDSTIVNADLHTAAIDSRTILDETIIAADIHTGAVESDEILDSTIVNADLHTAAIDSRTILNETIIAADIHAGAVESDEILDSTIVNADLHTAAIDSRTILDETIIAADIHTGAVESDEILDSTIVNADLHTAAIDSRTILDGSIQTTDIADGAINSSKIADGAIKVDDIADNAINLQTKVSGILPVTNGGTGNASFVSGEIITGNGNSGLSSKVLASRDSSIRIIHTEDSIILSASLPGSVINSDPAGTFNVGNLANGSTYVSNAINSFEVNLGDIVVGSIDKNLEGCILTAYVSQPNVIRIAIFNGTGTTKNLGQVNVKVYVIK